MLNPDHEGPDLIDYLTGQPFQERKSKSRLIVAGSALGILAVAAVSVFAGLRPGATTGTQAGQVNPALTRLIAAVKNVPQHTLDSAARNAGMPFAAMPTAVNGVPLTKNGKPEVFYVGAQFCPFCATENWALVVALTRFGVFSGLSTVRSAKYPPFPPLDTWTFYGSSYASKYLTFVPVELRSSILVSARADPRSQASYRVLQKLTKAQQALYGKYDGVNGVPAGVPFIDYGNKVVVTGSSADPSVLEHMTWSQIAVALSRPAGAAILTEADFIIANICHITGDRPASTCTAAIRSLQLSS